MTKEDDYRNKAAQALELAHRAGASADKERLIALTEKWLDLADRSSRITRDQVGKARPVDPLNRSKME